MSGLAWKLNRLRAMSLQEVAHRVGRRIAQAFEARRVSGGWKPEPGCAVDSRLQLFSPTRDWRDKWKALYSLDHDRLEAMLDGRLDLFAYEGLAVGRPVDWYRNPLTGQVAPASYGKGIDYRDDRQVGDIKVLWELGRHQHLVPLAAAYALTGNERYRNGVTEQIEGWIDANPFGMGIHWCSSLEVSLRLISWAVVHGLFQLAGHERGLFSRVADAEKLGAAIYQQAYFVRNYLSRYSSANNHLIGELCGLWMTCRAFDLGEQGEEWARFAGRELEAEGRAQVFSDGVDKEQAIYYHLWVLEYLFLSWLVGERSGQGFTAEFRERIRRMSRFLQDISLENGEPPQIGDADDGFVTRFEAGWPGQPFNDVQSAVFAVLGSERPAQTGPAQKAFWYSMLAGALETDCEKARPFYVPRYPVVYPEGGYAILGDEQVRIVFDAGPLGYPSIAAHGHADALSFCLGIGNEWWLVDPGTYAYHSEPEWRDYFRGTSAHNTLVVNGMNQSEIGGNFLWLSKANATIEGAGWRRDGTQWVRGTHNGYAARGVVHQREIQYAAGQIEIADTIDGKRANASELTMYFHFAPDVELEGGANEWVAVRAGCRRSLRFELDVACNWTAIKGAMDTIQGWYSPMIGTKVTAPVLVGSCIGPRQKLTSKITIQSALADLDFGIASPPKT